MRSLLFASLVVAASASACSSSVPVGVVSRDGTYVGTVSGSDAWIAVHANGTQLAVYACGGASSFTTTSRWYVGTVTDRHAKISVEGWSVDVDLVEGHAKGTMTSPSAQSFAFDAAIARAGSFDGLYFALDGDKKTGVIVRHEQGKDPVVQGTWFGPTLDARAQVTPIKPVDQTVFDVPFTFGGQTRTLTVKPFTF